MGDPSIVCTVCGDEYPLVGATFDDLRAMGYRPRIIHGKKGIPGLCPAHRGEGE